MVSKKRSNYDIEKKSNHRTEKKSYNKSQYYGGDYSKSQLDELYAGIHNKKDHLQRIVAEKKNAIMDLDKKIKKESDELKLPYFGLLMINVETAVDEVCDA